MSRNRFGMLAWGATTIVLAAFFLLVVIVSGFFYFEPKIGTDTYVIRDVEPKWLLGIYFALKENGSLVAGILGFSGLAWTHFYKAENPSAGK